jgi:hypothetical protein
VTPLPSPVGAFGVTTRPVFAGKGNRAALQHTPSGASRDWVPALPLSAHTACSAPQPNPRTAVHEIAKRQVDHSKFNQNLALPYQLRLEDFALAMADVYDFFYDVNTNLVDKGLQRLDDMIRPAALSGVLSDMITDSLAHKSRTLTSNLHHNGHPDLIVRGRYPGDAVKSGEEGVEIKATRNPGGAVDTHGARDQTLCVWVYDVDNDRSKASHLRDPLVFREIYLAQVVVGDFRSNPRGELGTRTATLDRDGVQVLRRGWVYLDVPPVVSGRRKAQAWRQA